MLNINKLRGEFQAVADRIATRNKDYPQLHQFKEVDDKLREVTTKIQKLNAERNVISKEIGDLIVAKKVEEAEAKKAEVQKIKSEVEKLEVIERELDAQIKVIMYSIPNIPHSSVQKGKDENDNVEVKRVGQPNNFSFKPLAHWELANNNKLTDFERAVKITGSRFTIYSGVGAKLIRALQWFTLESNIEAGFYELLPPVIVNAASLYGTGQLPKFEEDLYKVANENWYLSPTAEVQMTNHFRDEIIPAKNLPYYFTGSTACFRSEAGSAGKDTKGVIRQHQFYKTEMVKLVEPSTSYEELETMTRQAEKILEALKLPYRRILLCTGDMGFGSTKTYDIEVWLPSYNAYKEISSCSNCEDFQSRNLMMRYKKADGEIDFVHTLNGSGLAIDRLWAAVVENYQQEDGSIKIPEALKKYFDHQEVLK